MHRFPVLPVVALMLALGSFVPVAAQDDALADAQSPAVGVPLVYLDEEGFERGLITVTEVEDPFEGYPGGSEPAEGARYVLLAVAFENTGQQPFEARPDHLVVQDAAGFLWESTTVRRGDDIVIPDLQRQDMAPGNRITGVVGFQVPAEVELAKVFYQPQWERLLLLADLQPTALRPDVGSEVRYQDAEGVEQALVMVAAVEDPFADFAEGDDPGPGTRYVLLTVAFDNTGQGPFEVRPDQVLLRDTDGFLWGQTSVRRGEDIVMPDLQRQQMAPGNRISGMVGFQVPVAAELAEVLYQPESGRLILLADLQPEVALGPAATPSPHEGATGVIGNTYTSPTYGYALAWNDTWSVEYEGSLDGTDVLVLGNGVMDIVLEAHLFDGDAETCLADMVARYAEQRGPITLEGESDMTLAEGRQPLPHADATRAWAVYTFSVGREGTSSAPFIRYLDCWAMLPGEAVLEIHALSSAGRYNDQVDAMLTLLDTLDR